MCLKANICIIMSAKIHRNMYLSACSEEWEWRKKKEIVLFCFFNLYFLPLFKFEVFVINMLLVLLHV